MISELMRRFSSDVGYRLHADVLPFFHRLRTVKSLNKPPHDWPWQKTIVGVISNSDDRICKVLQSLGLRVVPRRIGMSDDLEQNDIVSESEDISFVVCSYDVGFEKPDKRIFTAAADLTARLGFAGDMDVLHVGDDLQKDVAGAENAGWHAVLLDRQPALDLHSHIDDDHIKKIAMDDADTKKRHSIPRVGDLRDLWRWKPN